MTSNVAIDSAKTMPHGITCDLAQNIGMIAMVGGFSAI
jgi:hypothetical protein